MKRGKQGGTWWHHVPPKIAQGDGVEWPPDLLQFALRSSFRVKYSIKHDQLPNRIMNEKEKHAAERKNQENPRKYVIATLR